MKKLFALTLAAVMTVSMSTVAFAAYKDGWKVAIGVDAEGEKVIYKDDDNGAYKVDGDSPFDSGDEIVLPLLAFVDANDNGVLDDGEFKQYYDDKDDVKMPKVYTEWTVGKAEAKIEMVKIKDVGYSYAVIITVPENTGNKVKDLSGWIYVGTSKSSAEKASYSKYKLEASYAPNGVEVNATEFTGGTLESDDTGIIKFDKTAGEIDIEFGDDTALFTVDVTGQGKLNLAWNTDYEKEFAAEYDYANIDFVTFEGSPSFNKTGTLYIYADNEDTFLYEVTANGAKAIKAEWDEDYEAWRFKTRTLSSYAISDVELEERVVTEDKGESSKPVSSDTANSGKPNPDTGR